MEPKTQPPTGCLGNWENGKDLAFLPHVLEKLLEEQGHDHHSILREWKDRGWLNTKGETKGLKKKAKVGTERTRCYVIRKEMIRDI